MTKKWRNILLLFIGLFSIYKNTYAEEIASSEATSNNNYQIVINDYAELLTEEEENKLKDAMAPITEYGHIIFESINENPTSTDAYARERYHELFGTESGSLFLIDMDNRYIYIFSDGLNYRYITNSKAEIITDNVYRYASDENYYECAEEAYKEMYTVLSGGKIAEPMRYVSNILISLILSFFICFLFVMSKSKIPGASDYEILNNCNIDFNSKNVTAEKTGSHRVYNPPSSSSGGGSSGGGGGGGSSGGGGGHGF